MLQNLIKFVERDLDEVLIRSLPEVHVLLPSLFIINIPSEYECGESSSSFKE